MKRRYSNITGHLLTLLIIFAIGLGNSPAGSIHCLPGCPTCEPVPSCCQNMADSPEVGGHQAVGKGTEKTGCQHGGICFAGALPNDLAAAASSVQYELVVAFLPPSPEPSLESFFQAGIRVNPKVFLEKSPPIYLQNCSFLI